MNELILTADGSHTLISKQLGVTYHSIHGAIQESNHVFIQAGLKLISDSKKQINILEMGFGTGLNALLTYHFAESNLLNIHYTTIEAYPIQFDMYNSLNYCNLLGKSNLQSSFKLMHESDWNTDILIQSNFILHKINKKLQDLQLIDNQYELIYFDAFSPNEQPELWEPEIFTKLFNYTKSNGILVTYCAKGLFKRTLKSCGFIVESIEGPPGKREMVRATKP